MTRAMEFDNSLRVTRETLRLDSITLKRVITQVLKGDLHLPMPPSPISNRQILHRGTCMPTCETIPAIGSIRTVDARLLRDSNRDKLESVLMITTVRPQRATCT